MYDDWDSELHFLEVTQDDTLLDLDEPVLGDVDDIWDEVSDELVGIDFRLVDDVE